MKGKENKLYLIMLALVLAFSLLLTGAEVVFAEEYNSAVMISADNSVNVYFGKTSGLHFQTLIDENTKNHATYTSNQTTWENDIDNS